MMWSSKPCCFRPEVKERGARHGHCRPLMFMVILCVLINHVCTQNEPVMRNSKSDTAVSLTTWPPSVLEGLKTAPQDRTDETTSQKNGREDDAGCPYCSWRDVHRKSFHLTASTGHVQWSEPARTCSCCQETSWHIQPAEENQGIVLHFLHFTLKWYESLAVYDGTSPTKEKLLLQHPGLTTAVLLLPLRQITVWVRAMPWPFFTVENDPSSFSLNYTTHPLHLLPQTVSDTPVEVRVAPFTADKNLYNCSSGTIPDYIRCDKVQQCVGGEDEPADCPYRTWPGRNPLWSSPSPAPFSCADPWFHLHHRCLQVITNSSGQDPRQFCRQLSGGNLAILPEPAARKLLGMVIARTGIPRMCLAVGLHSMVVSTKSNQMKTHYRDVLQWDGGIMNHGDPLPRRSRPDSKFALLFSHGEVVTTVLGGPECQVNSVTGLLCMKTGEYLDDRVLNNTRMLSLSTSSSPAFPYAPTNSTHVLKDCQDGSVVLQFQPCPEEYDQPLSANNFKLFDCTVHGQVHYSLVCDGHKDCEDGGDEIDCGETTGPELFPSHFLCGNGQEISSSKRCNGLADCLDQSDERMCTTCAEGNVLCPGFGCRPASYAAFLGCDTSAEDEAQSEYQLHVPFPFNYADALDPSAGSHRTDLMIVIESTRVGSKLTKYLKATLLAVKRLSPNVRVGLRCLCNEFNHISLVRWYEDTEQDILAAIDMAMTFHVPLPVSYVLPDAMRDITGGDDDRLYVSKVLLLVQLAETPWDLYSIISMAEEAKAKGVRVIAAGKWHKDSYELRQIVSQPLQENLYLMQSEDGITEVLYKLLFVLLPYGSLDPLADVSTGGLQKANWWKREWTLPDAYERTTVDGSTVYSPSVGVTEWNVDLLGSFKIQKVILTATASFIRGGVAFCDLAVFETPDQRNKPLWTCNPFWNGIQDRVVHRENCPFPGRGRYVRILCSDSVFLRRVAVLGTPVLDNWRPPRYTQPPAVVQMDGAGMSTARSFREGEDSCPDKHFQCSEGFCIPTYLLNNGIKDCPLGEDEDIDDLTCPGFFRCVDSGVCLHADYLCDGVSHCPFHDDERYCGEEQCPQHCVCEGLAFHCQSGIDYHVHRKLVYLNLSGTSEPDLEHIGALRHLRYLNLSFCQLKDVTLDSLSSLHILDLSHNNIRSLDFFKLGRLAELVQLDLSYNQFLHVLNSTFSNFVRKAGVFKLKNLSLVGVGLETITTKGLDTLQLLSVLDIRENPVTRVQPEVFGQSLRVLYTDKPKWCCRYFRVSDWIDCQAPVDELSSCDDLLRSDVLRVLLWFLSIMALTGNVAIWVFRMFIEKQGTSSSYRILVLNLSAADFFMGVYMAIIGSADISFHGVYVQKEEEWRHSVTCKAAGFLAMLSSEMSAFVMCLITLDFLLVLRFPFSPRVRLTKLSSSVACSLAWLSAAVLAALPLFMPHWNFYSHNSICLPLPITRQQFSGQQYAFGVFIILNFLLFLVIAIGQLVIYHTIRQTIRAVRRYRNTQRQEVIIARRLFLIVFTDLCCWFPIGVMGLLAAGGTHIPNVVNVWAAVFIVPLNSAINPFLYTLNTLLARQAERRKEKQLEKMLPKLKVDMRALPAEKAMELFRVWLRAGSISKREFFKLIVTKKDWENLEHIEKHLERGSVEEASERIRLFFESIKKSKEDIQCKEELSDICHKSADVH